jgi:cysteine synthase A
MIHQAELPILSCLVESVAPTPLQAVQLDPGQPSIWCKLEYLNPSGSTKDRIAAYILSKAWREGVIGPGSLVSEAWQWSVPSWACDLLPSCRKA